MNLIRENPDKYGNLEYLSYLSTMKNDLFAIDLFFIYVKLFEYLNFNRTMAQLNNTLHRVSIVLFCTITGGGLYRRFTFFNNKVFFRNAIISTN